MRAPANLLLALFLFAGTDCYSQRQCSDRIPDSKRGETPLTYAELAHRVLSQTLPEERHHLYFGDVEFILRCGTPQDAEQLFEAVRNTSVQMTGVTVVGADQYGLRVSLEDRFNPNPAVFRLNFETPLMALPNPGEKIVIIGTYSSYSREPFQITMTRPSFVQLHLK